MYRHEFALVNKFVREERLTDEVVELLNKLDNYDHLSEQDKFNLEVIEKEFSDYKTERTFNEAWLFIEAIGNYRNQSEWKALNSFDDPKNLLYGYKGLGDFPWFYLPISLMREVSTIIGVDMGVPSNRHSYFNTQEFLDWFNSSEHKIAGALTTKAGRKALADAMLSTKEIDKDIKEWISYLRKHRSNSQKPKTYNAWREAKQLIEEYKVEREGTEYVQCVDCSESFYLTKSEMESNSCLGCQI